MIIPAHVVICQNNSGSCQTDIFFFGNPDYRVVETTGPDHAREFTVEVVVGDTVLGRGSGKSKKMAEMEAARIAVEGFTRDFTG